MSRLIQAFHIRSLWFALPLAVVMLALLPGRAQAQSCSVTISDMDFGAVSPLSTTAVDALATLRITCTSIPNRSSVKICASISDGSGGSSGAVRLMRGPSSSTLSYQLFQDSSRTRGWGATDNTQLGAVPAFSLGNGSNNAATGTTSIYARLYGSQTNALPGSYTSAYTGVETAFTYAAYTSGATANCEGFAGSGVARPEFDVTASPAAGCSITSSDLTFPAVGVLTAAIQAEASLSVTCTNKTTYSVGIDNGISGTSPTARKMTSAAGTSITYGLYRNAARTLAWGGSGQTASGTGTGGSQTMTVYGIVPVQTTPAPGTYSDRVVVTLTY